MKGFNESKYSKRHNRAKNKQEFTGPIRKKYLRRHLPSHKEKCVVNGQLVVCLVNENCIHKNKVNQKKSIEKIQENLQYQKIKARQHTKRLRMSTFDTRNKFF
jgi:hypothetical protein